MSFEVLVGDSLEVMRGMADNSVDLVCCSPPYEAARTYGIDFKLRGQDWVDWAFERFRECLRVCSGLVCWVAEGQTRNYRWSATPVLLMADLHRAGVHLRKPCAYNRIGIPGSGGPDWFRNDYEFCICATKGGKLPWSDNTAMGHPPRWAPGGELSYRLTDGERKNGNDDPWGKRYRGGGIGGRTSRNERRRGKFAGLPIEERKSLALKKTRRDKRIADKLANGAKMHTKSKPDGTDDQQCYLPPVLANPGNVITVKVGGGLMGDELAHENEAPYPESLVERFVRSCCPPNGTVLDPFSGSGTTGAVALRFGRNYIGIDIRQSQVELTKRRLAEVQRELFP